MNKEISKSPEILEKEALIKDLQSQLTKRKRILKGLKTRLENTKVEITDIQRAGSGQIISKMSTMEKLRLDILELVKKMRKIKGLSIEDKAALDGIENEFSDEDIFGDDFKSFREQMDDIESPDFEAQFDENERAKMRDIFEMFAVKPSKEEQKDIRKIFISLSQKFHPDKAPTKADEAEYHQMMQKINQAYQAGDIQTLLELERLFLTENLDLTKVQSLTADVLEQEIERLERDLQFIENQIDRNSSELKNLRTSDLGKMLTDLKKAEKQGAGMNAALEQLDDSIGHLTIMKDAFEECIELGNTKPLEKLIMAKSANQPSQTEMMAMLEEMMKGELDPNDLADMFGGLYDEEEEVENAKFNVGMSVKIGKNIIDEDSAVNLSGLIGRVEDVYYDYEDDISYEIELDSISLNKLPAKYVEQMVDLEEDFQNFDLKEKHLKKCQPRDTKEETQVAYQKNLHRYLWNYLDKNTQNRLQSILLYKPELMDWENWELYLNKKLKYPIAAKSRGRLEFRRGEKLKITRLAGYNKEVGLVAEVHYRKRPGTYPLFDLVPNAKNKEIKQIFDDYLIWAEELYDLSQF